MTNDAGRWHFCSEACFDLFVRGLVFGEESSGNDWLVIR